MTWRRCTEDDREMLMAHLETHLADAMFPYGNLRDHPLDGDAPRAMRFWWDGQNALGLTREGMLMPVAPNAPDWAKLPDLDLQHPAGILGETTQVRSLRAALALDLVPVQMDADEPSFDLALKDLVMPTLDRLQLVPLDTRHRDITTIWRSGYCTETLGTPESDAYAVATRDIDNYIARNSHRVLMRDDTPVGMTGFNMQASDTVQVGGVYTPPHLRRQGLARAAVALHLAEARDKGAVRAVLFAASEQAARAYQAIGFTRRGSYSILLFGAQDA